MTITAARLCNVPEIRLHILITQQIAHALSLRDTVNTTKHLVNVHFVCVSQHSQMLVVRKKGKAHARYNSFRSAFELLESVRREPLDSFEETEEDIAPLQMLQQQVRKLEQQQQQHQQQHQQQMRKLETRVEKQQQQINELQMENKSLRTQVNVDTIVGDVL